MNFFSVNLLQFLEWIRRTHFLFVDCLSESCWQDHPFQGLGFCKFHYPSYELLHTHVLYDSEKAYWTRNASWIAFCRIVFCKWIRSSLLATYYALFRSPMRTGWVADSIFWCAKEIYFVVQIWNMNVCVLSKSRCFKFSHISKIMAVIEKRVVEEPIWPSLISSPICWVLVEAVLT